MSDYFFDYFLITPFQEPLILLHLETGEEGFEPLQKPLKPA